MSYFFAQEETQSVDSCRGKEISVPTIINDQQTR
jgi:hypothetical protein